MPKPKDEIKEKTEGSESITFRIGKTVMGELRQEAEQKMESVNTLVNQIIKSYLQWHKPARKAGLGYVSKVLMTKSINHLTDEQVIQMTQEFCSNELKDITFMLRSENTFSSFMDGLCSWLDASGYNYRIDTINNTDTYIIQFDMGRNWSFYFKTQMQLVLEYYNIKNAETKMTDNTVILNIKRES
jgi:hypothetical protein